MIYLFFNNNKKILINMKRALTENPKNTRYSLSSNLNINDFTITTITAKITGQEMVENTEIFKIHITDNYHKKSWIIEKDSTDFNMLYNKLSPTYFDIPTLPPKQIINQFDAESVNKKKDIYQHFLTSCLNRKDIYSSFEFKYFLNLKKNSPDLCGNTPLLGGAIEFLPESVTDFKYIEDDNIKIIILTTAEMGVNNIKTDEEYLKFKNRLENENDEIINNNNVQGMTMIFEIISNEGVYNFKLLWQRKYKCPNTCIYYDKITKTIFIGREDGFVSVYKHLEQSHYTELELIIELKNHFSRITDIWYDVNRAKMFTVSNDRRLVASDVNLNSQMVEVNRSVHNYTKLIPDLTNNRLFAATEGGIIELYSLDKYPPEKKCRIRISGLGYISDFYFNKHNSRLFTCDHNGKISIIEIGEIGKEKISSQISQFGFKNRLTVIEYDQIKHEIITGDTLGKVIIWNIKTGEPVFSWVAHKNMAITSLYFNRINNILITGAKDKSIKIWKVPEFWFDPQIEKYENEDLAKINNELRKKRIQMEQIIQGNKEINYESDQSENEEDLNGWNYDFNDNIDHDNINAPPEEIEGNYLNI